MDDITADVIARKLEMAAMQAGKIDGSTPPGDTPTDKETFWVFFEGKRFKVTVEADGEE